jgi:hypothetical protein
VEHLGLVLLADGARAHKVTHHVAVMIDDEVEVEVL